MRLPSLLFGPLVVSWGAITACSDSASPGEAVRLRTDSVHITLAPATQVPRPVQVFLVNATRGELHVRMCNNGGFPTADLLLHEQYGDSLWYLVPAWTTCGDPSDGFDLAVAPGDEARVARIIPAPHPGVFRYLLVYASASGRTEAIVSNPVVVE